MKPILVVAASLAAVLFMGWIGLQVKPQPFPPLDGDRPAPETVPLPEGLPAPVERYFRQVYGDEVPVVESAVISGRASMVPVGPLAIPVRFRFFHQVGRGYRHHFEMTWFGRRFGTGNEHYIDGTSRLALPFGLSDEGPRVDEAANLSMWAEYVWIPAALVTDPRVRWQSVDDETALLMVPYGDDEQTFVARFDRENGRLAMLESMRYRASDSTGKTLWINESSDWTSIGGYAVPATGSVTWLDQGRPWAVFKVEDIQYNVDVSQVIREGM